MLVEVRPGPLSNKGGELMLRATVDQLRPAHTIATEHWIAPYAMRAELVLYQKVWFRSFGPLAGVPAQVLPNRLRHAFGMVAESEIGAVVDAAGFAYSDQFGAGKTQYAARMAQRWRKQGKRLILLPQAFGPFERPDIRDAARELVEHADLVYARDAVSLEHLRSLGVTGAHFAQVPDITIGMAAAPSRADGEPGPAYVVPNEKVITHGPASVTGYVEHLAAVVDELARRKVDVAILLHETADRAVAERLQAAVGTNPEIIGGLDGLRLRELIGGARLVVASRYHALVSALAQGVPVIASGWSHKYESLLSDFGCPDLLVDPAGSPDRALALVDRLTDESSAAALRDDIRRRGDELRGAIREMWSAVHAVLGSDPRS